MTDMTPAPVTAAVTRQFTDTFRDFARAYAGSWARAGAITWHESSRRFATAYRHTVAYLVPSSRSGMAWGFDPVKRVLWVKPAVSWRDGDPIGAVFTRDARECLYVDELFRLADEHGITLDRYSETPATLAAFRARELDAAWPAGMVRHDGTVQA